MPHRELLERKHDAQGTEEDLCSDWITDFTTTMITNFFLMRLYIFPN